jgi:hypothetical protein
MSRRLLLLLLAGANVALAAAVLTRQPWANGPAEWRWEYLAAGALTTARAPAAPGAPAMPGGPATPPAVAGTAHFPEAAAAGLGALLALAGLGVLWGHPRLAARWIAAPLAVLCGTAFTFALVAAQPGGFARVAAALASRNSFGYVWDAALAPPSRALLADYPAASAGLNQHSVTHPPGPLLAVRALGWLDRLLPAPAVGGAAVGERTEQAGPAAGRAPKLPALAAAAIAREVERARGHGRPVPRPPPGPWAVTALALLLPALSALAAWPLYSLGRRWGYDPRVALLAALLWLLVPARSLFTPSFDQALPLLLVGAAALAAAGGSARAAAAGALLFAACFTSYGCLAALPLVAACSAAAGGPWERGNRTGSRWLLRTGLPLALGFALPYLALAVWAGHDPWHALRAALALHRRIAVAPRSYATWLLWNPYDFALLLSPAVLGLAAAAALLPWQRPKPSWRIACWTWWGMLALLLASGGVRGEAGRIWLIWMPFACLFAAPAAVRLGAEADGGRAPAGASTADVSDAADAPHASDSASHASDAAGDPAGTGSRWPLGLLLATEAALTLALAASMTFVS